MRAADVDRPSVASDAQLRLYLSAVLVVVAVTTALLYAVGGGGEPEVSPLGNREGNTLVSFGDEVIVWGGFDVAEDGVRTLQSSGARWDGERRSWTSMAPSPLSPRWDATGFVFEDEVFVMGGFQATDSAVYTPASDTWRVLESAVPLPSNGWDTSAVWTGTELLYWHSPSDQVWTYSPATDEWSAIDGTGIAIRNLGSLVPTDLGVFAVSDRPPTEAPVLSAALLAPGATAWEALAAVDFASDVGPGLPSSQGVIWAAGRLFVWAASGADSPAFVFNAETRSWEEFAAPAPLRSCEFALSGVSVGSTVVARSDCLAAATLDTETLTWAPTDDFPNLFDRPMIEHQGRVVGLGEDSTMWEWWPPKP